MSIEHNELHKKTEALRKGITSIKDLCGDDDILLADMVEGETDIDGFVSSCIEMIAEDQSFVNALKERVEKLNARKDRLSKRIKHVRTIVSLVMDEAAIKTLQLDQATVTIKQMKPNIIVNDESELPSRFFTRPEPKLNKSEVKKYIAERDEAKAVMPVEEWQEKYPPLKGINFDNGDISLTIRSL